MSHPYHGLNELRELFLKFFETKGHLRLPSFSLVPQNDKSILLINAGMTPMKPWFKGEEEPPCRRVCTCQKCIRTGDIDNVGKTARHGTYFEMLGNFSFGDYFKSEAITWAWKFVTEELELPKERLWVTVFREDDEAAAIWQEVAGLPAERIVRMGEKDNFWTMGDTGPCGPCSEIYIDQGEDMACGPDCGIGKCDCDRFLEIWNLVFTQFDQHADGTRDRLARPNIDTGMGLERIAAVCQGKRSNFDCDLFQDIIQYAAELAGVKYSFSAPDTNDVDTALRVIADHARAAAFLIADGTLPSNESRGYVLRRLIRRALRFATLMGVHEPFLYKVARKVTEIMGEDYPELTEHADFIARAVHEEEQRFSLTLGKGLALLEDQLAELEKAGDKVIPGEFCFKLSDTYGFPLDIITDVSEKRGFSVDVAGFEAHMAEQRRRARESQKKSGLLGQDGSGSSLFQQLADDGLQSVFTGYSGLNGQGRIVALLDESGLSVEELPAGQKGYVVTNQTPFYGESGGQAGDTGRMEGPDGAARVLDTQKPAPTLIVHNIEVEQGLLRIDQEVALSVEEDARMATARNHSCTHLLHAALRSVLGTHVKQAGSLVNSQRLRFDFSHIAALTPEELAAVERQVNRAIMADYPVCTKEMKHDEAVASGAMALFNEKYGDTVRVVSMGDDAHTESVELCGGTHLDNTAKVGPFEIESECSVASGVRRIEAITGKACLERMERNQTMLLEAAAKLKTKPIELGTRIQAQLEELRELRRTIEAYKAKETVGEIDRILFGSHNVDGLKVITASVPNADTGRLRQMGDVLRDKDASVVAVLATVNEGKITFLAVCGKDAIARGIKAGDLVKQVCCCCGGSGGGKPDSAMGGGKDVTKVDNALAVVDDYVVSKLK